MLINSRGLRERVVRALAKVGLVWALAVLGFVFTATAAAGSEPAQQTSDTFSFVNTGEAPRTAGLALALTVLGGGLVVLVVGGLRAPTEAPAEVEVPRLGTPGDLSLALGLGLAPYSSAA